jgi:hypothetical protein
MVEKEGAAFLGMAAVARLVDAVRLQQRLRRAPVRIVAIGTRDLPLRERHVRPPAEFRALRRVALKAGFADRSFRSQSASREVGLGIMAIAACNVAALVRRSGPEDALAAAVTGETLRVLLRDGRAAAMREADNAGLL